jgi:ribosome-associated heat shock protein Hsp15
MRIDEWLWAARFFKTRSLAARACELGRIESNGHPSKPSREVRVGDRLLVPCASGDFEIDVLALSQTRGPAPAARSMYAETGPSREARAAAAELRRSEPYFESTFREGKPSKKDRRDTDRLRGRIF